MSSEDSENHNCNHNHGGDHTHHYSHHTVDSTCEHDHTLNQILAANIPDTEIILDVGCGSGATTRKLSERLAHKQIYAFDESNERIEYAREHNWKSTINFFVGDVSLPWDSLNSTLKGLEGKVSLVWSNHVLHCLTQKQLAVDNLAKLIKNPGGRAYINIICMRDVSKYIESQEDKDFVSKHVHIGTKEEQIKFWRDTFQAAGFREVEVNFEAKSQHQKSTEQWEHMMEGSSHFWRNVNLVGLEEKLQDEVMERIGNGIWRRLAVTKYGDKLVERLGDNPTIVYYEEIQIVGIM